MKINDKGFAFSTMLYGVLSLIIIVLILVFSLLKHTNDETYYYSSIIEENLNKCVEEEVALENCYTSNSSSCDTTSYYACLGINNSSTTVESIRAFDFLKDKTVSSGNGIYIADNGNLVFKGLNVNNYIQYSGDIWRIIEVEANGALKIAYTNYGKTLKWDANGSGEWKGSSLENELNNNFYLTLNNNSIIDKRDWNIGRIYDVAKTLTELIEQEELVKYNDNNILVGIPNASDYVKASLNSSCSDDVLNSVNCNSWLSSYGGWLINSSYKEAEEEMAYYFATGNKLLKKNVTEEEKVIPVIYLKSNVKIKGGDGTISNPYILER